MNILYQQNSGVATKTLIKKNCFKTTIIFSPLPIEEIKCRIVLLIALVPSTIYI